jgi:hypothetical protein
MEEKQRTTPRCRFQQQKHTGDIKQAAIKRTEGEKKVLFVSEICNSPFIEN